MSRKVTVLVVGVVFGIIDLCVSLEANSLATSWQHLQNGAWSGTTDPGRKQSYQIAGLLCLCFGFLLMTMGAWEWLKEKTKDNAKLESIETPVRRAGQMQQVNESC